MALILLAQKTPPIKVTFLNELIELVNFIANQKVELAPVRKKLPALIAVGQKGLQVVEFSDTAEEDEF